MPTVLIVDDDKFTRTVLETIFAQDPAFRDGRARTVTARDGEDGLAAFRKHAPRVVITDILMPQVDGLALCSNIRAEPGGADTALVVMSGVYRDSAVVRRVQDEFDAEFFAKPYQLRELSHYVSRLIGEGARAGAAKSRPITLEARHGDLALRPLPAVLFDLLEAQATGRLTLRRGRVHKRIDLVFGHPVSVTSSRRDEALGPFLVSTGAITGEQLATAVIRASHGKRKLDQALIDTGAITPEVLIEQLTLQTRHKLVQVLRWPDGAWRFEPDADAPAGPRGNPIDLVGVVLQGLSRAASVHEIPPRVAALESRPLVLTERGARLLPALRKHVSGALASAWRDGVTARELAASGPPGLGRAEVYAALELLLLCDAVAPTEGRGPAHPRALTDPGEITVQALSERSQTTHGTRRDPAADADRLYSTLFDDSGGVSAVDSGQFPIELMEADDLSAVDSGVLDMSDMQAADQKDRAARRALLSEFLRIQGLDHYDVLSVDRTASRDAIEAAATERRAAFAPERFAQLDLGRDYAKLEDIHAAYNRAAEVLLDDDRRARYDRYLTAGVEEGSAPSLDAEIAFRAGEDLVDSGHYDAAIHKLAEAVTAAPDEADYHALLGWACYVGGGRDARAADQARPHLNQALAINPDHAGAHDYKGVITAELGNDDAEAIFHLERALDLDPARVPALDTLRGVWARRGEFRPLERQHRRLIYRAAATDKKLELALWIKLAELYRNDLDDPASARVAYESAARLSPHDPAIKAALADLQRGTSDRFFERGERLRRKWRQDSTVAGPGLELLAAAVDAGQHDAAFIAASALVARQMADARAEELYRRYRPRFLIRAQQRFTGEVWGQLRHDDDRADLGELFALLSPVIAGAFPLSAADLDIDDALEVADDDLPESFVRVRSYVAYMLDVTAPPVVVRPDFGHQIHVGAIEPPILLAGDEALTSPERSELGFRLGRAMSYLLRGRAVAGSRPSRSLKAAVMAAYMSANPHVPLEADAGVAAARERLDALDPERRDAIHDLVERITRRNLYLNLSRWTRALARTADRVGLLLCGDLPAALRFARDCGGSVESNDDLLDFAISSAFLGLRAQLGLSVDV